MNTPRVIFAYSVIVVFLSFSVIGALGAIGWIQMAAATAQVTVLSGCLGIVVAILKAHSLFHDPESATKLKNEHSDEVRRIKNAHADIIDKRDVAERQLKSNHAQAIAAKDAELNAAGVSAINEKTKRIEAERQLSIYKPRPNRPDGSRIAPGH